MLRAVGCEELHEIPGRCEQLRQRFASDLLAALIFGLLRGIAGELEQLHHPVHSGKIGDGNPGEICFAIGAIRLKHTGIAGREQVAGRTDEEQVVLRIARLFDEIAGPPHLRQIMREFFRVARGKQDLGLHHHARRSGLVEPIVHVLRAVTLLVSDAARCGGVPQTTIRADVSPHGSRFRTAIDLPHALAIALVVPKQIPRTLQRGKPRLRQKRGRRIGKPITVLNPPMAPVGTFLEAVPVLLIEHGDIRQIRIHMEKRE